MYIKLWKVIVNNWTWSGPRTYYTASRNEAEKIKNKFPAADNVEYAGKFSIGPKLPLVSVLEGKELRHFTAWDGTTPETNLVYPVNNDGHPLFIDHGGNITYLSSDGDFLPWCARSRLRNHLNRLFQLGAIQL